ncbi:MAG: dicarboxylate/amino acid:cation symporter [Cyanobacteriota bacterium]
MFRWWTKLEVYYQIFIMLFAGAVAGVGLNLLTNNFHVVDPDTSALILSIVKPFGDVFIRMIQMVVIPLVFASLVLGVASLGDPRKLGRIGSKTIAYFLITTGLAVSIGLTFANLVQPGAGFSSELKEQLIESNKDAVSTKQEMKESSKQSFGDIIVNIVPKNPIKDMAEGNMLPVIFFALMIGICLSFIDADKSAHLLKVFDGVNDIMIVIVNIAMKFAPYGVFSLIMVVTCSFGVDVFIALIKYSLVVLIGLTVHAVFTYGLVIKLSGLGFRNYFVGIKDAILVGFSTSSSSATLPVSMKNATENLYVKEDIVSFVLPLGATINMNGTALYQGVAAVFIAQVFGIHLNLEQQLIVVLTATLAAIGAAGVPSAGIVTLLTVLQGIGVPAAGVALIMGVDRLLDMFRTAVNIMGEISAALFVGRTEGQMALPIEEINRRLTEQRTGIKQPIV